MLWIWFIQDHAFRTLLSNALTTLPYATFNNLPKLQYLSVLLLLLLLLFLLFLSSFCITSIVFVAIIIPHADANNMAGTCILTTSNRFRLRL